MHLIKLLLITTILSIIPGQLIRLNLTANSAVNITDSLVLITFLFFILYFRNIRRKIMLPGFIFPFGAIFFIAAAASNILSLNSYSKNEVIIATLFLIRFFLYASLSLVIVNTVKKSEVEKFVSLFIASGFIFTLLGFLQFVFYPNLSSLQVYGWDPHINRLASTTFDPNFTGGLLIILICICIGRLLYYSGLKYAILSLFFSVALLLTFSRSSYFAYAISMLFISVVKSPRMIIIPIALFIFSFTFIPGVRSRIIGAITIDETSMSRIESWQNALVIIRDKPFFGVGFNNYRNAQRQYGFFDINATDGGHSGAGTDSSLLLVLATTGIFGFSLYIAWLATILKIISRNIQKNYLALSLTGMSLALLVHSQFVNSLFYPQILMPLILLISLKYVWDL